jgi:hypothetical protein
MNKKFTSLIKHKLTKYNGAQFKLLSLAVGLTLPFAVDAKTFNRSLVTTANTLENPLADIVVRLPLPLPM